MTDATLFRASEVARMCQVDLKTIHNWAEDGKIEHFRTPGRHLRFTRGALVTFFNAHQWPLPSVLAVGQVGV